MYPGLPLGSGPVKLCFRSIRLNGASSLGKKLSITVSKVWPPKSCTTFLLVFTQIRLKLGLDTYDNSFSYLKDDSILLLSI